MKIQFKKLVWNTSPISARSTNLFDFVVFWDSSGDYFILEITSISGLKIRMTALDMTDAKQQAQSWFEEHLLQFIETSENPAQ